ncbi:MAG: tripartite tricarboxylate transporter permease, partial [Candidatus Micrarchaeota archaeon]
MDFIAIAIAFFTGFAAGVTGALPFVHTNNILAAFASLDFGAFSTPIAASVFAVALSFSHLAFETIPALFLALPAQNQSVAALPAQKLVLQGRAEHALFLITRSLFLALLASLCLAPLALFALPALYAFAKSFSALALIAIVALAVLRERGGEHAGRAGRAKRAALAISVFVLSGAVGFAALVLPVCRQPLFPLLAGLFGVPAVLFSFGAKPAKPKTEADEGENAFSLGAVKPTNWKLVLAGVFVGALSVLFPALSPALLCGAIFFFLESDADAFLETSSALIASKMFFDFAGVFAIGKARSGAAAFALEAFASQRASASLADYALVCAAALAALALALALLLALRKRFASFFSRVSGNAFSASLLVLVALGSLFFSGWGGLLVLAAAGAAGC